MKISLFSADVTSPLGHPLCGAGWFPVATRIADLCPARADLRDINRMGGCIAHCGSRPAERILTPCGLHNQLGTTLGVENFLTQMDYQAVRYPVAEEVLDSCIYIRIHEQMSEDYIDGAACAIIKLAKYYHSQAMRIERKVRNASLEVSAL